MAAATVSTPFSISMLMIFIISMVYQAHAQLPLPRARQTTSVFYLQDVTTGPNATVAAVTGIKGRDWNYNTFGSIFVVDDPVMLGPSPSSTVVGRAQGLMVVSSHDAANVNVVLSIVFSNSQYSGSTLELQGISRQRENYKELSVVSGTGQFRFARGYASLQTVVYDPQTTRSIIRLTVTIQT
ncbi:hypothetical protein VNO80_25033 [Phaseolus coccineus]|uniref:Dirigent protein n=1 Tax=Phaseolus coccineus TaxID=3886 RepID=A0AAN9LTJ4_PHACN